MASRARPRRFRLFNAHLDEYLSENYVKSRFRFGGDSINYLADLLSDDLARNTAFRYALPSPWALTIRPKIPGRISGNFHGQMVQSFPGWKTIIVRLEFIKSTSWLFIDRNTKRRKTRGLRATYCKDHLYLCKIEKKNRFSENLSGRRLLLSCFETVTLRLFRFFIFFSRPPFVFCPWMSQTRPWNCTFCEGWQAKILCVAGKANPSY